MTSRATTAAMIGADRDTDFATYVAARQSAMLRMAYLLTGDTHAAEDLVQTALAKLYLAWGRARTADNLDAYTRRILINEHTSWWRRAWRRHETTVDTVPERAARRPDHGTEIDERDALWSMVLRLAPRQRAAVVLRYYEDLSEAQTAEVLGCSVGTVKSQTSRALATLRMSMSDAGGAPR